MRSIVEVAYDETIIGKILKYNINQFEAEIALLEEDIARLERTPDLWIKAQRKKEAKTQTDFRLTGYRFSLYERQIVKLNNEIMVYQKLFNRKLIDEIEYELFCANVIDSPDHTHEELISPELSYIYKSIVSARVDIFYFQKSSLGENDYSKEIASLEKKIVAVQEFTFVDTYFKFPELPHITIQKLIVNLCDEKKSQFSSKPFQPVDKDAIKTIGKLLSGKKRAPKEQKNLTTKEREKFRLQEKFKNT